MKLVRLLTFETENNTISSRFFAWKFFCEQNGTLLIVVRTTQWAVKPVNVVENETFLRRKSFKALKEITNSSIGNKMKEINTKRKDKKVRVIETY